MRGQVTCSTDIGDVAGVVREPDQRSRGAGDQGECLFDDTLSQMHGIATDSPVRSCRVAHDVSRSVTTRDMAQVHKLLSRTSESKVGSLRELSRR